LFLTKVYKVIYYIIYKYVYYIYIIINYLYKIIKSVI